MKKTLSKTKNIKTLNKNQVGSLFKKINRSGNLQPIKIEENQKISDKWIMAGDNSSLNNELKIITSWQTGQVY